MIRVDIYTDGAARKNGQPDAVTAWGWVMLYNNKKVREDAGRELEFRTNNQNELYAVVQSLRSIQPKPHLTVPLDIHIFSDSAYVVNANKTRLNNLSRARFVGKPNEEIWNMLIDELNRLENHQVTFNKVKGHSGNQWNEYVDALINSVMDLNILSLKELV